MARDILQVRIELNTIHCFDEGDGWGVAEPYLWPVFFKIDGETCSVTDALMLTGTATVEGTAGHHGNLGTDDVDAGDTVNIPNGIGNWQTNLKPIPGPPSLPDLVPDVPGVVGVVTVLMEEDNVSDDGAVAGYEALVSGIRTGLNNIIPTLGFSQNDITEEQIAQLQADVGKAVEDAIKANQGFLDNLWSWLNPDDRIGSEIFKFSHDDLAADNLIPFEKRWRNEGDWRLRGEAISSVLCPAEAVEGARDFLGEIFGASSMKSMRKFRDDHFKGKSGLDRWWGLAGRNAASLMWLLHSDKEARAAFAKAAPQAVRLIEKPDTPIPDDFIAAAGAILDGAAKSRSRRARSDSRLLRNLLELCRKRTVKDMIAIAQKLPPDRAVTKAEFERLKGGRPS